LLVVFAPTSIIPEAHPSEVRRYGTFAYLIFQVVTKLCRTVVDLASSGRNPAHTLIASFLVLIIAGAGLLMLPRSSTNERAGIVDALFTATSATCVTGLIVRDTGYDFSLMGQIIILTLIQLGGLGIVIFGVVFALLIGQALGLRGSAAMQDLLSTSTIHRIGRMVMFIFVGTLLTEAVGAAALYHMWDDVPDWTGNEHMRIYCSIFHSISAFCNAGFSLFSDSFVKFRRCGGVYTVICPLIILGGLGFGVLFDLMNFVIDRIKRLFSVGLLQNGGFDRGVPKKVQLQTRVVLCVSGLLIIFGALSIYLCEHLTVADFQTQNTGCRVADALFQSITARTAGFNTVDISGLSVSSRFILILLMFIGGSPGSTAGGIKTVTLAVVLMTAVATIRKRDDVEMFRRSVRLVVVGRAITVVLLFVVVLFTSVLALSITERNNSFNMSDIMFESASALGTVGLTTGITGSLTISGKLIIIAVMLIGRLGPLTLLTAVAFDLKPVRYNYPDEAVVVG
jgi:trk system potassium uptake protein TrkH